MRPRHLGLLALVALFAAFGPAERTAPTRWALMVGISDYINFGDEIGGDLPGAVNDIRETRNVFVARMGFPEENIRMLLDAEATRENIRKAFTDWLPSVVKPGDLVVFYFAGHGSQMWDESGDEDDGLDETICPADVVKGDTKYDINDDEMGAWLDAVPSDNVVVLWDKCHAESSTRAATPFSKPRSLDRNVVEDVPRPRNVTVTPQVMAPDQESAEGKKKEILELAASQSDEVAVDALWQGKDGKETYGGAFSTLLVRNLWNVPVGTSYKEIFELTRQDLKRERFAQTPTLMGEGTIGGQPAFVLPAGAAGTQPAAAGGGQIPVLAVPSATEVVLGGGSAANITVGSLFEAGSAILRVTRVAPDRAHATVVKGQATGLAPGAGVRLVAYRYPEAALRVSVADLAPPARSALAQQVAGLPTLELVEEPKTFAHVLVRPQLGGKHVVLGLDGATRHTIATPLPGAGAATLADLLRREWGALQLAELDNPAHPFKLEFSLTGSKSRFRLGELVEFRVRSARDGYLTIVDLGTDGNVTVIFPNEADRANAVKAGQELVIPTAAMQTEFRALEPTGRGIVRAFVTAQPLELPFTQGDARQAERVAQALRKAAGQPPVPGTDALPLANWATAAIVYEITK